MAYTKSDKGDAPMRRRGMGRRRKKVCVFCGKAVSYTHLTLPTILLV